MLRTILIASAALALGGLACTSPDEGEVTFSDLHARLLVPRCATATCHVAGEVSPALADAATAYRALVGRDCGPVTADSPPGAYVVPFEPARSRLVQLLRADASNLRMPPDEPLPSGERELVERWILEGATCEPP